MSSMTIRGVYSALFKSNHNQVGAGIVVIDGATLHGGDLNYLYKGKYKLDDKGGIDATVDVDNYSGLKNAVVGPFKSFRLTLKGIAAPHGFALSGAVEEHPKYMIQIDLIRISDLVDQ